MNRFPFRSLSAVFFAIAFTFSLGALASEVSIKKQSDAKSAFAKATETNSSNPWHFSNLYDDATNSFFVPYHLWSGAKWNGKKSVESCIRKAFMSLQLAIKYSTAITFCTQHAS